VGAAVKRPRLGFLGVGWIGRNRLGAIAESGVADIVAIADAAAGLAEAAARAHAPAAKVLGSLDELLACELDGVAIATPSALHADQSVAALDRGVAVFCQKPLGRSAAEAARVVEAARRAQRLLAVDLSYRHTQAMQIIRRLVAQGELGDIFAARLVFHNAYGPDKPWFYDRALSGGGCVTDLGIHLVDLALWTLDFPEVAAVSARCYAAGKPLPRGAEVCEDYAVARLDLATGASVEIACSWRLHAGCDAVISAEFHGTRGGAALRNVGGSFYSFTAERFTGTRRDVLTSPPDLWGGRAARDWAERLASGARYDPAAERLVEVARTLDRIYEA
jgi:predicted dehydrogenase